MEGNYISTGISKELVLNLFKKYRTVQEKYRNQLGIGAESI